MNVIINNETGKEREVVYFKHNNNQVLAEYVNTMVATGKYRVEDREDNV